MINYRLSAKLLSISILLILLSCQEDTFDQEPELLDEDMIHATELAKDYISSTGGRTNASVSIIVLKYQNGKLLYVSNTDEVKGYEEISEETVTATVNAGDYVFWYSGKDVSELDGIQFDEVSQLELDELPEEIYSDKLWYISVPQNEEEEDDDDDEDDEGDEDVRYLKYDIIYQYEGNDGPPIRLDPKIKVQG